MSRRVCSCGNRKDFKAISCRPCSYQQGRYHLWTPESCIASLQAWATKHGRVPTAYLDWRKGGYGHPSERTVVRHFGSWNAGLAAAGLEPNSPGPKQVWTRDSVAAAMLDHLLTLGRWPYITEWRRARKPGEMNRPNWSTVQKLFPNWTAAKLYAGWHPDAPAPWRCIGCGREGTEDFTLGCRHCDDRRQKRERTKRGPALDGSASKPSSSRGMRASTPSRAGEGRGGATPPNKPTRRRERSFATAASDRKEV